MPGYFSFKLLVDYKVKEELSVKKIEKEVMTNSQLSSWLTQHLPSNLSVTSLQWLADLHISDTLFKPFSASGFLYTEGSKNQLITEQLPSKAREIIQLPAALTNVPISWLATKKEAYALNVTPDGNQASFWKLNPQNKTMQMLWSQKRRWGKVLFAKPVIQKGQLRFLAISADGSLFYFDQHGAMTEPFPVNFNEGFQQATELNDQLFLVTNKHELIVMQLDGTVTKREILSAEIPHQVIFSADQEEQQLFIISIYAGKLSVFDADASLKWTGNLRLTQPPKIQYLQINGFPPLLLITDTKMAETYLINLQNGQQFWQAISPNSRYLFPLGKVAQDQKSLELIGKGKSGYAKHTLFFH